MKERAVTWTGADYFAALELEEKDLSAKVQHQSDEEDEPFYTGRPGGRATCPICGNEETRNNEHGRYRCESCGFETGNIAVGDESEPRKEPADAYEALLDWSLVVSDESDES